MGFSREETVIYEITHSKDMENLKKDRKNLKTWSMTKKYVNFFLKASFRNLDLRIFFPSLQNSAPGLRLWSLSVYLSVCLSVCLSVYLTHLHRCECLVLCFMLM